jgi:hypothetical protein
MKLSSSLLPITRINALLNHESNLEFKICDVGPKKLEKVIGLKDDLRMILVK